MKRILVTGSRTWTDKGAIRKVLFQLEEAIKRQSGLGEEVTLVHGAADGADKLCADVAIELGWTIEPCPIPKEYFKKFGSKAAPLMRNQDMVNLGAWVCVAFADGDLTGGTLDTVKRAVKAGIQVRVVPSAKAAA